ncbi:hypothetical protein HK57_00324 [Aspergillus ustus]|uniref:AAA+ ATPase domain-containing protein n=1 Tax=Aspergillus ustus TaxID=40382 RepID=A0A0C1E2W5_ASPUT|nr:hypothetical protein HK57_00324 [Aspergillus ustus]
MSELVDENAPVAISSDAIFTNTERATKAIAESMEKLRSVRSIQSDIQDYQETFKLPNALMDPARELRWAPNYTPPPGRYPSYERPTKPIIERVSYEDLLNSPKDCPDITSPAIVVIYAGPAPRPGKKWQQKTFLSRAKAALTGKHGPLPVLVLINAQYLRYLLEPPTWLDISTPVAHLPPFSGLIPTADLSGFVEGREDKAAAGDRTGGDIKSGSDRKPMGSWLPEGYVVPPLGRDLLMELFSEDLAPLVSIYRELRSQPLRKIAFEHLCFLFAPGDLVTTPEETCIQAYHVSKATGGTLPIPIAESTRSAADDNFQDILAPYLTQARQRREDFIIECFYYDSDGELLGPTKCEFKVKPYEGEIPISSLPVVPLRYASARHAKKSLLAERGLKYMQLTRVSHMYYEGVTSRESEEVNSEVIIDMKTAYGSANRRFQPPVLESLLSQSATTTTGGRLGGMNTTSLSNSYRLPGPPQVIDYPNDTGSTKLGSYASNYAGPAYLSFSDFTTASNNLQSQRPSYLVCLGHRVEIYDTAALDNWQASRFQREQFHSIEIGRRGVTMPPKDVLILLPRDVPGFALRNRKWHYFYLDYMTPPYSKLDPTDDGFEKLAIPKSHKSMVLALVRNHSSGKSKATGKAMGRPEMDLVRGKGKGLIILLHGVPGVGKTSTAECVASFTRRPLYPITCGDLGETAREVEENLEAHFTLAHRWGCILLLDESDVFLAKRERGDIKRNALVSVFLRVLEYYPGILFLTTNRVGHFDEAFKSRIHIALYYPPLNRDFTLQVWNSCLTNIERQNEDRELAIDFDRDEILTFAADQYDRHSRWNGRQIRNAFQTAIALAEYDQEEKRHKKLRELGADDEGELSDASLRRFQKRFQKVPLSKRHFRHVAEAFAKFDSYMLEVQQRTDAEQAEGDGIRADGWDPAEEQRQTSQEKSAGLSAKFGKSSVAGKISVGDAFSDDDDDDANQSDADSDDDALNAPIRSR